MSPVLCALSIYFKGQTTEKNVEGTLVGGRRGECIRMSVTPFMGSFGRGDSTRFGVGFMDNSGRRFFCGLTPNTPQVLIRSYQAMVLLGESPAIGEGTLPSCLKAIRGTVSRDDQHAADMHLWEMFGSKAAYERARKDAQKALPPADEFNRMLLDGLNSDSALQDRRLSLDELVPFVRSGLLPFSAELTAFCAIIGSKGTQTINAIERPISFREVAHALLARADVEPRVAIGLFGRYVGQRLQPRG